MPSVLLLGAGSDIAGSLARKYAAAGYDIQLAARNASRSQRLKQDIAIRYNVSCSLHEFDAVKPETHAAFFESLPTRPDIKLRGKPSDYMNKHFNFTYMTDTFGIRNRQDIGVKNMLWCSDYPHISADWPHSWRVIQSSMSGLSQDDRQLILAGNAQRLYGFGR